tara:strand:- start:912 stop:1205 length:294 start_codon:yes stop_codon:yes gene_type:complete
MVQVNWTIQAVSDLRNIADYISRDSNNYAKLQVIRIKTRSQILREYPNSGQVVPEIGSYQIRQLIEGNYRIIYKVVSPNQVDILTIYHSARKLRKVE